MRVLRIVGRGLLIIAVLITAISAGGYAWLRGGLPQTGGVLTVQGISAPVEIIRDANAVPTIRAASANDALFGLGYAHAQDRLWQMEFQRRVGYGRLSEIAGPATIDLDRFLRTLGADRAAQSAWAH